MSPEMPDVADAYDRWTRSSHADPQVVAALADVAATSVPWLHPLQVWVMDCKCLRTPAQNHDLYLDVVRAHRAWTTLWHAQGCPHELNLMHFQTDALQPSVRATGRAVAHAVDRAIVAGIAPLRLIHDVQVFLPGGYLDALGWANLTGFPTLLMRLLVRRSESASEYDVNPEFESLVKYLFGIRNRFHANVIMFAAVSLMGERTARGERNSPMTIKNYLKSTCHVLDAVFNARGLIAIKEMRRNDVKAYIEGTYGKTAEKSTRIAYVRGYLAARDAQLRFLNSNNEFRDLLLPHPSDDCSIPAYHRYAENESRERRSTRVSALAPHYLNLLQGITKRAEAFQQIRRIYERHRAEFVDHREPVEFLVTLPDRSAELKFRIVDMFQRQYELDGNLMARQKGSSLEGKFVTEIRGIHGGNGGTFVEHLYSLRYAPDEVPRSSLKSLQKSDLKVAAPGLFFPAGTLGTFIRKQNRRLATTSIRAPVAVDLDAVCAGISLGSLLVLLSYAFPLRIHELQQIRREADYTFETAINCLLTTICPKGQKRDKKCEVEHYIHPYVLPFWMDFISILENAEWSVQRVAIQNAAEFGFEKGFHLFQWNGIALRQNVLTWLLRCSTHGLDLSSKGDKPAILTFHLLRHLYARTGIKFGRSKLDISESLGHRSPLSTQTYLDGLDDALLLHPDSIMSSLDAIIIHPLKGGAL